MKLLLVVLALTPIVPAASAEPAAQILDPAGDANGITFPYAPGGVVGNLQRELVPTDPTGPGVVTGAGSHAPADILAVRLETSYVSIPVGEDGMDHQVTGIRLHMRTTETPRSLGPTTTFELGSHLPPGGTGCRLFAQAVFTGPLSPNGQQPPTASASLGGTADGCGLGNASTTPGATELTVTSDPPGLSIEVPHSAFPEGAIYYLDEGATILQPIGWTAVATFAPRIDATVLGPDFTIGQDMPEDVPCTKGCPTG